MTLEMRDQENVEKGKICYMIEYLRELNFSEDEITKIIQKEGRFSEDVAKLYLEEAADVIQHINEHRVFMDSLCEVISNLKSLNTSDEIIILNLQDKFNFVQDDAEFYFNYVIKSDKYKVTK